MLLCRCYPVSKPVSRWRVYLKQVLYNGFNLDEVSTEVEAQLFGIKLYEILIDKLSSETLNMLWTRREANFARQVTS